ALLSLGRLREFADPDEAVKNYRRALELNSDRDDVRLALAQALLRDRPDLARPYFEELLASQPDNTEAMLGLAQVYVKSAEWESARELLNAVLEKKPDDSKALGELGALLVGTGRVADGEGLLREAIAADFTNADAHWQLQLCLAQQGRKADAAAQAELHKRVEEDNRRLLQLASKEMTSTPNDPNLHYEMGAIFLRNGKPALGVRWLERALRLDPAHQRAHQALYEYFKSTGDTEQAEQHRQA